MALIEKLNLLRRKFRVFSLQVRNSLLQSPVTGAVPVLVSITTHGRRLDQVWLTLESIAQGKGRPKRIILWLDEANHKQKIGLRLRRLCNRGVEIKYRQDLGPHTKYYHSIDVCIQQKIPLVTADDDAIYTKKWLQELYQEYQRTPGTIVCNRARLMSFDQSGKPTAYDSWPLVTFTEAHPHVFLTGVSGAAYPIEFLYELKERSMAFLEYCPKADDVWLNYIAAFTKTEVRQCQKVAVDYAISPDTQASALWQNNRSGGNDEQIAATYDADTIRRLHSARLPVAVIAPG